jgi:hypothetical protein
MVVRVGDVLFVVYPRHFVSRMSLSEVHDNLLVGMLPLHSRSSCRGDSVEVFRVMASLKVIRSRYMSVLADSQGTAHGLGGERAAMMSKISRPSVMEGKNLLLEDSADALQLG